MELTRSFTSACAPLVQFGVSLASQAADQAAPPEARGAAVGELELTANAIRVGTDPLLRELDHPVARIEAVYFKRWMRAKKLA